MLQIMIKWLAWHPGMPWNICRAGTLTILEPTNAREVTRDAAAHSLDEWNSINSEIASAF